MDCPECCEEMELVDTTYSNTHTDRASKGEKTGDIYYCAICCNYLLNNYLTGKLEAWSY